MWHRDKSQRRLSQRRRLDKRDVSLSRVLNTAPAGILLLFCASCALKVPPDGFINELLHLILGVRIRCPATGHDTLAPAQLSQPQVDRLLDREQSIAVTSRPDAERHNTVSCVTSSAYLRYLDANGVGLVLRFIGPMMQCHDSSSARKGNACRSGHAGADAVDCWESGCCRSGPGDLYVGKCCLAPCRTTWRRAIHVEMERRQAHQKSSELSNAHIIALPSEWCLPSCSHHATRSKSSPEGPLTGSEWRSIWLSFMRARHLLGERLRLLRRQLASEMSSPALSQVIQAGLAENQVIGYTAPRAEEAFDQMHRTTRM